MTERRRFLVKAGGALAAVAAAAIVDAPNVIAQPKFKWRMPTTWTPALDVLQGSALRLSQLVEEMSGGRFRIEVSSAGQIMPPLGVFDATSQGTVEAFMASTVHWPTKDPALVWFCTVPFGMNPEGMMAWFYQGDGLKLWEETYAAYNLVPRPGPGVAPQMAGWFRKKINTTGDFKGLKMRIPGLGGKVVTKAGGTVVLIPGGEIYAALERGAIDASEFVGPHDDMKLGLHNTARYYYYPGWHEPGAMTEFTLQQEGVRGAPRRPSADARLCGRGDPGLWPHGLPREERDRAREAQDGVQDQGRGAPAPGAGAARSEEAGGRGHAGRIREEPHGEEDLRVLHEVPGAGGPLGSRRGRRLPSVRGHVTAGDR